MHHDNKAIAEALHGADDSRVALLRYWLNIVWAARRRLFDSLVERARLAPLA